MNAQYIPMLRSKMKKLVMVMPLLAVPLAAGSSRLADDMLGRYLGMNKRAHSLDHIYFKNKKQQKLFRENNNSNLSHRGTRSY